MREDPDPAASREAATTPSDRLPLRKEEAVLTTRLYRSRSLVQFPGNKIPRGEWFLQFLGLV